MILPRGRFFYRLTKELMARYRSAFILGFILGLVGSLGFLRFAPAVKHLFFSPIVRVGMVGDFTPTNLPLPVQTLISMGLTSIKEDGSAGPGLASSWEAEDNGKAYTFHLRGDKKWHSGKAVVARDINYNIKDVRFIPVDASTLKAELNNSYSPFPTLVTKPLFEAGLVGFGSYRVESVRLKGNSVLSLRLVPVEESNKAVQEYRFYKTEALANIAFKRGDIDRLEDVTNANELAGWGRTKVESHTQSNRIVMLYFNLRDQKFTERSFRQALAYGVTDFPDQTKAETPFSLYSWAKTTVRDYAYDQEQVKKLLKVSKVATSSAELTLSTFTPLVSIAQEIANSWSKLGIPAKVKVINDLSEGFEALLGEQIVPPDPDQYTFWHSQQKDTNITGYVNLKADKLLEDARSLEMDQEKRKKLYADFARRLVDDAPVRFLYYPKTYTITRLGR